MNLSLQSQRTSGYCALTFAVRPRPCTGYAYRKGDCGVRRSSRAGLEFLGFLLRTRDCREGIWKELLRSTQRVIGVICLALATPAILAGTSWFLFVVVLSFVATLIWIAIYLIGVREALTLPINWIMTELLNTGLVTVLYAIAFIVQLSVWSTPYSSSYRSSNIAAGVFGLINTAVYAAACFLLYRDWRATLTQ